MISRLPILALLALASLPAPSASGAASTSKRNYSVTSFDKVRVDGPYQVSVKTNVTPYARASGSGVSLDGLSLQVQGRTLIVRSSSNDWGGYPGEGQAPVTIEVGTHELASAYVNGAGSLDIDKVRGLNFSVDINGPGVARIGQADVDQLKVGIAGAGTARLAGKAKKLTAIVRGTSSFDAEGLAVTDAVIGAAGPSMLRAAVSGSAKIDASGLAAITLTGNPACTVKAQGSASVSGCKQAQR